jgi:hypothetical protein
MAESVAFKRPASVDIANEEKNDDSRQSLNNQERLIEHNNRVLNQLVAGDLVQYKRGLYSHWAVYVGNGLCSILNIY